MFSSERVLTALNVGHNKTEDPQNLVRGVWGRSNPRWLIPASVRRILSWILLALAPNPPEKVENVNLNSPVARLLSRLNNEAKTSPVKQAKHPPCADLYRLGYMH